VRADKPNHPEKATKEVTMVKRLMIVAIVLAAILVLAAPALAFDGYRATYTNSTVCQGCHNGTSGPLGVFTGWQTTKHADVGNPAFFQANALPIEEGPGCAGCHSGNYSPVKATPIVSLSSTTYPYVNTAGDDAFSEPFIGCSACHWGTAAGGGTDPADTAHSVPYANMANAQICGQCHSRFSKTVNSYAVLPTTAPRIQPEYTLGDFNPLGMATSSPAPWVPDLIGTFLQVPTSATPVSQVYYADANSNKLPFVAKAHAGGATQYEDWANPADHHSVALDSLKAMGTAPFLNSCLKCHSTDYRIIDEWNQQRGLKAGDAAYRTLPTIETAKYGITCQACHTTHDTGAKPTAGVWNADFNTQLKAPAKDLCVQCHNAELQDNPTPGVAMPGQEVHHPMKEMMNGTGAIDVPQGSPSVHKGKCVQCHMPPTGYNTFDGSTGSAANHVFQIIQPMQAVDASATLSLAGAPAAPKSMPYSACSKCHARPGDEQAVWIQGTLTDRQDAMKTWDAQTTSLLKAAAGRLGFKATPATATDPAVSATSNANTALNAIGQSKWTTSQLNFQKAFTNQQYIESEGSWGIHNWDYARTVILKAQDEAKAVTSQAVVTLKASKTSVKKKTTVKFTGNVRTSATGKVTIQKKTGHGSWKKWKTVTLKTGSYSVSLKMTSKGTFSFRSKFAASATQKGGTSSSVKVVVK
jgi:hypothetical protein